MTEKQVIQFAHKFDPQMFHLTRKSAERTIFKGLIASGWHTAAMTMRLLVQTLNFTEGAIGLGVDELRWPNPVRPGDSLCLETEIVDLRPSRSKPNYGIVRLRNVTTNQRDGNSPIEQVRHRLRIARSGKSILRRDFFIRMRPVDIGGVEECDAQLKRAMNCRD